MKKLFVLSIFFFLLPSTVYAMHIAEGFLPMGWAVFYFILCAPFVFFGFKKMFRLSKNDKEIKMLIALSGAYVFLLSALKLPSVTGSCSHPTGVAFSAIMFGPFVSSALSVMVLIFQALLLAHGGLTTLGANVFSMGIVGSFVSYLIYKLLKNRNIKLAVFLAAALGDLSTYVVTSLQLALAFPSIKGGVFFSFAKFIGIFFITQIPLAVVEGIFTVILFDYLMKHAQKELSLLEVIKR